MNVSACNVAYISGGRWAPAAAPPPQSSLYGPADGETVLVILTLTTPLSDNHNSKIRGNIAAFSFANTFELKDEKMCVRQDPTLRMVKLLHQKTLRDSPVLSAQSTDTLPALSSSAPSASIILYLIS